MSEDWKMVKLEDCFVSIRNGANIKQYDGATGIPITRIETLSNDLFNRNKLGYANIYDQNKYVDYLLKDGDILMSHINSLKYLGRAVLYRKQDEESIIHGMNLLRLQPDFNIVISPYINYYFATSIFKNQIGKIGKKSVNQASFTVSDLKKIKLILPDLSTQLQIAATLDKASELIALRKKQLEELDALAESVFYDMFGDLSVNNKTWVLMKGEEYCNNITVGVVIKPASYYVSDGVVALRSLNIKPNKINLHDIVYFSKEDNKTVLSKSILKHNDVVIVRTGSTGTAAVIPKYLDGCNCIDLIIARPDIRKINSLYLVYFFNSDTGKAAVNKRKVGGIQKHFNIGMIKSLYIPIPPIDLQNQFAHIIEKIETQKSLVKQALQESEDLFQRLMQDLFKPH